MAKADICLQVPKMQLKYLIEWLEKFGNRLKTIFKVCIWLNRNKNCKFSAGSSYPKFPDLQTSHFVCNPEVIEFFFWFQAFCYNSEWFCKNPNLGWGVLGFSSFDLI